MKNPFLIMGHESPEFLCDRKNESDSFKNAIDNSRNVTLISECRLGKTMLISHVEHQLENDTIFIDLYPMLQLKDFIQLLSSIIMEKLEPSPDKALRKITGFFSALKPEYSFDTQTGTPSLELSIDNVSEAEK